MPDNPMVKLGKLRDAIEKLAKEHHLEQTQIGFIPAGNGNPDAVTIVFKVGKENIFDSDRIEQMKIDGSFEDIVSRMEVAEKEAKREEEAKRTLDDMIKDWFDDSE